MVTIKVFFEGGANPTGNPSVDTMDNTNSLREGFNKLLNSAFDIEEVKIEAIPAYSISNIVNIRENSSILLMDLDDNKTFKQRRLTDNKLLDIEEFVFFMVQRMESWIISQPEVIERVFKQYKAIESPVMDDSQIINKHPEDIQNPDKVLGVIFSRYFRVRKNGQVKKMKYRKLIDSYKLIENLNISKLIETFEDVKNMVKKINEMANIERENGETH